MIFHNIQIRGQDNQLSESREEKRNPTEFNDEELEIIEMIQDCLTRCEDDV